MGRPKLIWLLLIALLAAVEPVLHTHPIVSDSASSAPCAACVNQTAGVADPTPTPHAPQQVAYTLVAVITAQLLASPASILPSRAPPAL